jgi:3-oxoadipate enol-lactonase
VRYDHRGHGRSPVSSGRYSLADLGADVLTLLDRLAIERTHFVGLSLGGMVGMWLAQKAPHRLRSLTLCCTSARLEPRDGWADRARLVREQGTQAVSEEVTQRWFTPRWRDGHPQRLQFYRTTFPKDYVLLATKSKGISACRE